MRARSSESPFTIVFTVEYSIGLEQPATPKRYQAINLNKSHFVSPCFFPCINLKVERKEGLLL